MIVCVCRVVCDRAVDRAVEDGARTLPELMMRTRAGTGCGACHDHLRQVLRSAGERDCASCTESCAHAGEPQAAAV